MNYHASSCIAAYSMIGNSIQFSCEYLLSTNIYVCVYARVTIYIWSWTYIHIYTIYAFFKNVFTINIIFIEVKVILNVVRTITKIRIHLKYISKLKSVIDTFIRNNLMSGYLGDTLGYMSIIHAGNVTQTISYTTLVVGKYESDATSFSSFVNRVNTWSPE